MIGLAAGLLPACDRTSGLEFRMNQPARLELTSYRDPYFPERYQITFPQCAAWTDRSGDIHVVGSAVSFFDAAQGPVRQMLHAQVYWRPRPGKTPADASLHDAVLRYVAATETGVSVYAGSGFVVTRALPDGRLAVALERAEVRRVAQQGDAPDWLGPARLSGVLLARQSPAEAVEQMRELEYLAAGQNLPAPDAALSQP